jgi:LacI family transcriptional regulator
VAARTLSGAKSYLMAFLAPEDARTYIDQQLRGVLTACQKAGYHVVVEFFHVGREDVFARVRALCSSTRLDGAVLAPGLCDMPEVIALLDELGIAHVGISPREAISSPYVYIDDVRAAYEMTQHLLGLGHRRIAFIGHRRRWRFAERRLEGFRSAMKEAGIAVPRKYIVEGSFTFRSGQECAEKLLALEPRPTAVFAINDETAIGAMTCAYQHGLSIPRDLSIAGFDDSPLAAITWPQLTTVRQPIETMAAAAAERVLRSRAVGATAEPVGMLLPVDIVVRGTTAKPLPER